ncbi:MAG TPA: hypothetical protein VM406_08525 [Noviherbaspirillum sp.]|nr:hypothetical protein [Noviherbaspirillum sp.]
MEPERNKPPKPSRRIRRRRISMVLVAAVLAVSSCGRHDEGPLPPHSPPRPTTLYGGELTHAHFHLPARPSPPLRGMM